MGVDITFTSQIAQIADALPQWAEKTVEHVSEQVLGTAQDNIRRNGQVKTGRMLHSGVVEPGEDRYSRYVAFLVLYAIFQELGTRSYAGRPFLIPSVEQHRQADTFADVARQLAMTLMEKATR